MAESFKLPWEFVDFLTKTGLSCGTGNALLNSYLSSTSYNGGSDSAVSLIGATRSKVKDGGTGQTMHQLYGSGLDRMWRGCGSPTVISDVWKFLCRNKEQLKSINVTAYARRDKKNSGVKIKTDSGKLFDLYFKGRTDAEAIQKMVEDRFFGMDCIGFLGNFLVWAGEWNDYISVEPSLWPSRVCKINVKKASDIRRLDVLCWPGHVAMVDWIWETVDEKTVRVDICQSSTRGPECNSNVILREVSVGGTPKFKIQHRGTPAMPVDENCIIQRREGFYY